VNWRIVRRLLVLVVLVAGVAIAWASIHQTMPSWYARLWYPLEYEEAIKQHAERNDLDPALIAAVIHAESGFVPDSQSSKGAVGLMQILPATAQFVADQPGRPSPAPHRLEDPEVNIAYGSRYMRYLVDSLGSVPRALAAYNGGESNVRRWLADSRARGKPLRLPEDIPFSETRAYVDRVEELTPIYRRAYSDELSLGEERHPRHAERSISSIM
jgi:soluble lytic murein transglycosylase